MLCLIIDQRTHVDFGILELHVTSIRLRVDTQKKMQELISPQKGEEDPGQNHGLGPGKGQKELLKELDKYIFII